MVDGPITHDRGGDPIVLSVVGELDMGRESELLNLVKTLDPPPESTVDVDLSAVTFVDSTGIRAILNAQSHLKQRACSLRVVNPQPQFVRVIELSGLRSLLNLVDLTAAEQPDQELEEA
jgi:anti-anti-sigma factor